MISKIEREYNLNVLHLNEISTNVYLVETNKGKFVCKQSTYNIRQKYQYLKSQSVSNVLYPLENNYSSRNKMDNLIIFPYLEQKNIRIENHITSMFQELINLHQNTRFKSKVNVEKVKPKLEEIYNYINYKFESIEYFVRSVESKEFDEDSIVVLKNYHYILDSKRDLDSLLRKIVMDIKENKTIELCFIHNHPTINHFINNSYEKYFISIESGRIGVCSLDIAKFYVENVKYNVDLKSLIVDYLGSYDSDLYYNYFCFLVLLIYIKSLKMYNKDYYTSQSFLSVSDAIKKFRESFIIKNI